MVYYNPTAENDLGNIVEGLARWRNYSLGYDHAMSYVDDIKRLCDVLDNKPFHSNAIFPTHREYGSKVHTYKRNRNTTWYIIYNLDLFGNVYINRIINNYLTVFSKD